jgi:ferredoxin
MAAAEDLLYLPEWSLEGLREVTETARRFREFSQGMGRSRSKRMTFLFCALGALASPPPMRRVFLIPTRRITAPMMTLPHTCRVRLVRQDGERMIEVQRGEKLRTALLRRGATPHNAGARLINCRGLGTCGTCAVEVDGTVEPANHTIAEKLRMNLPPHSGPRPGFRLACQVTVESDLVVRKRDKFWGQGEALAPERNDARVSWLGELEYSLDFTSPPPAPCSACGGTQLVACPLCEERGAQQACKACRGSGQVVCRSCFDGNPWDIDAVRARARRRPD